MALIIGDIHGCIDHLDSLLNYAPLECGDTIITLGDYIDRGPNTKAVLQRLIDLQDEYNLVPILGNHDKFMLDARHNSTIFDFWMEDFVGGTETLESYGESLNDVPQEHWEFLENCQLYHELEHWICAHGGAHPELSMDQQNPEILLNLRFSEAEAHQSGKKVIVGHTRQRDGMPKFMNNTLCIDTNVFDGGFLTGFDTESNTLYQVDDKGNTRQYGLGELT